MRWRRWWRPALLLALVVSVLVLALWRPESEQAVRLWYVSPSGSDSNPGSKEQPFATLTTALAKLHPGDTLYVRGGVYHEQVRDPNTRAGTRDEPIQVLAFPGERPVVSGLLWLRDVSYWTIDGLNVTWDPAVDTHDEHMVKFTAGSGWTYAGAEVWGARSYAAILVTGGASDWTLRDLFVHDTYPSNGDSQDQLIYVSSARRGRIEHNLLVGSPNGRGVKLGRPQPGDNEPAGITVRYNTIVGNAGGNISGSYDAHDNLIERNILVDSGERANIEAFQLEAGGNNVARDNIGWDSDAVLEESSAWQDGGGNREIDPQLDSSYRPTNPALLGPDGAPLYGHLAQATDDAPSVVSRQSE